MDLTQCSLTIQPCTTEHGPLLTQQPDRPNANFASLNCTWYEAWVWCAQGSQHCQTDIIRSIVCTDMGFVVTLSYDRAMYIYQEDHMTTPKRVAKASAARFSALAWDKANNWLLTGAADGCVKVWSQEGRILDELMHTSDQVLPSSECFVLV